MEARLVRILVEVATIQMETLKTEVEKGSKVNAFSFGLFDPNRMPKGERRRRLEGPMARSEKGRNVKIRLMSLGPRNRQRGSRTWHGDDVLGLWKSFLFFLTDIAACRRSRARKGRRPR